MSEIVALAAVLVPLIIAQLGIEARVLQRVARLETRVEERTEPTVRADGGDPDE